MAFLKGKGGGAMGGARKASAAGAAKLISGFPLVLLALAAWAVTIAGLSVVRHETGNSDGFEFSWFVVFLEIFVLLACLAYLIGHSTALLPIGHAAIAGLLAVVTTLSTLETQRWYTNYKANPYSDSRLGKGAVTAFAGWISLAVLNGLLIIALGNSATLRKDTVGHTHGPAHVHHNPVGTAPVVGAVPVATAV